MVASAVIAWATMVVQAADMEVEVEVEAVDMVTTIAAVSPSFALSSLSLMSYGFRLR